GRSFAQRSSVFSRFSSCSSLDVVSGIQVQIPPSLPVPLPTSLSARRLPSKPPGLSLPPSQPPSPPPSPRGGCRRSRRGRPPPTPTRSSPTLASCAAAWRSPALAPTKPRAAPRRPQPPRVRAPPPSSTEDPVLVRVADEGVPLEGVIQIEKLGDAAAESKLVSYGSVSREAHLLAYTRFFHGCIITMSLVFHISFY
uniref:Uncharacterized protein n=3 Tax=Zea mays TaxID=4577 RepID=A0A804R8U4_MAIZE